MAEPEHGLDFRRGMIEQRLARVRRLLLVMSGKGGVGKSVVSAALAGKMAESGLKAGLMDADIYGPSSALLFGAKGLPAEGESGLVPPIRGGVKVMSVDLFASGRPIPLAGSGANEILVELLALTDWGDLDCLVVDMPPATGDIMLTLTSLRKEDVEAVVVTMPDRLSTTVAHRVLQLLSDGGVTTVGVLGNMVSRSEKGQSSGVGPRNLAKEFGVPLLGLLPYDASVSRAVERGEIRRLLRTRFAKSLQESMGSYLRSVGKTAPRAPS
jgi:ATP-binding protein involved in chromosome partitioning